MGGKEKLEEISWNTKQPSRDSPYMDGESFLQMGVMQRWKWLRGSVNMKVVGISVAQANKMSYSSSSQAH